MPRLTKGAVGARSRAATLSPMSPQPGTSKDYISPSNTRTASPPSINRKVCGRPPNRAPATPLGMEELVNARLQKILDKTEKVMTKLSALGLSSVDSSDANSEMNFDHKSKFNKVSPSSGYSQTSTHNLDKKRRRHKKTANEKMRSSKRPHPKRQQGTPSWKRSSKRRKHQSPKCRQSADEPSSSDEQRSTRDESMQEDFDDFLFAATANYRSKKGKKLLYPWEYIITDDKSSGAVGSSTWPQYLGALFIMSRHRNVPTSWSKYLLIHIENLCTMAEDWSWPTCLRWSEKVFKMIEDGRLANGWLDAYAIKDVQRDVCLLGSRAKPAQGEPKNTFEYKPKAPYDKLTDGVPCRLWNNGKDCGSQFSHGSQPNRECHLCSWCINKFNRANAHREIDCINKGKWDKPTQKQNTQEKDF